MERRSLGKLFPHVELTDGTTVWLEAVIASRPNEETSIEVGDMVHQLNRTLHRFKDDAGPTVDP